MKNLVRPRSAIVLTCAALAATALAGCSSSKSTTATGSAPTSAAAAAPASASGAAVSLKDVCPATVAIQMDWEPEAEYNAVFNLLGPTYTLDAAKKRVSGPLMINGQDSGVNVEIRAGGSAVGFQTVESLMYTDSSLMLGFSTTDSALSSSGKAPVTAVAAIMNYSPQMIMWDPASHPDWNTIADIGKTTETVAVSKGAPFINSILLKNNLLKKSQIDISYTGAPANFVKNPKQAQQGFATAEPYIYEHEVPAWGKPVKYQLLKDVGYVVYPEALSVRTADLAKDSACLKKLIPAVQQSEVNYAANPGPANALIVAAVKKFNDGWVYTAGVATFAHDQLKALGLTGNGPDGVGSMDPARVQQVIDGESAGLTAGGATIKAGVTPADLATNQFIDPSIKLPS